jgi:hypothetical protein
MDCKDKEIVYNNAQATWEDILSNPDPDPVIQKDRVQNARAEKELRYTEWQECFGSVA